jgi:hypothetical protein
MIGTNYFLLYHIPDVLVFSDHKTRDFNYEYVLKGTSCKFLSRPDAFEDKLDHPMLKKVDYWFNHIEYKLRGMFTAFWAIQLIKRFFPDKIILLFGFDFYVPETVPIVKGEPKCKCYDFKTDYDIKHQERQRNPGYYLKQLDIFENDIRRCVKEVEGFTNNIWNCNLNSHTTLFKRKHYKDLI